MVWKNDQNIYIVLAHIDVNFPPAHNFLVCGLELLYETSSTSHMELIWMLSDQHRQCAQRNRNMKIWHENCPELAPNVENPKISKYHETDHPPHESTHLCALDVNLGPMHALHVLQTFNMSPKPAKCTTCQNIAP